ncbi:hypothetical protein LEP1GSC161_0569 [Leptospira santarosai str. CBC1416]|uniref:Uncharacterized protein n=4 Tax=Leptospira santarosai TaxID=28183 RepID=M6ULU1_9LEPT|nr:hypothetical protein LEP1GSC179_4040 [Leptospira santarosai str. MOR084]EKO76653.1 hypothetical protein LEP1GSC068_1180 [Leptospira sp. Fiocruz LV3954]EKS09965.1 hypothetical protein LEP1GSC071_0553 [Leptospira santarosai str. JET]EMF90326.1 hypothetical protein LEP1GSC005_2934 [Leptospira santarosai str. ST188]EMI66495.1 hypothetical protein LEP1GSC076_3715 [Leptospira sp. Fiocruz LV4135]EMJ47239.1 hypothetical protein LEP1GSC169_1832 [Leptospira santarosai str. HAI1349]EMM78498.1 hypothe
MYSEPNRGVSASLSSPGAILATRNISNLDRGKNQFIRNGFY